MRCLACNRRLTEAESTRKSPVSGMYYDLCNVCFSYISDDVLAVEGAGELPEDVETPPEDFNIWRDNDWESDV